ncbi:MAG TPA: 16S rRNA (adenine(1518)-N(6)/adenine(1519)-N(6))-dimethyltransferase RsmA [Methylomirabilota bacterium]|nr:16S rRNA (adenine(1518)-N(6)/adenine(1519)-N(6))-dimethyltransferase RsmA [Methylomirabilota bacterium]
MAPGSRRQALGQHFLVDPAVADRIVEAVGATAADLVCEIGAGPGILTRRLAARAGRLVALEIDPALQRRLADGAARWTAAASVDIRLADARTFAYEALPAERPHPDGRVLVAGNLPYSASKPILARLLAARPALDAAVVMLQREVAARLVADPGTAAYGALTVFWQLWADLALVTPVPPAAFRPPPAVESAVVAARFRRAPRVPVEDPVAFAHVVRAAFGQRRKTLWNALRGGGYGGAGGGPLARALAEAGIDGGRRAETLTLAEFARLARALAGAAGAAADA